MGLYRCPLNRSGPVESASTAPLATRTRIVRVGPAPGSVPPDYILRVVTGRWRVPVGHGGDTVVGRARGSVNVLGVATKTTDPPEPTVPRVKDSVPLLFDSERTGPGPGGLGWGMGLPGTCLSYHPQGLYRVCVGSPSTAGRHPEVRPRPCGSPPRHKGLGRCIVDGGSPPRLGESLGWWDEGVTSSPCLDPGAVSGAGLTGGLRRTPAGVPGGVRVPGRSSRWGSPDS